MEKLWCVSFQSRVLVSPSLYGCSSRARVGQTDTYMGGDNPSSGNTERSLSGFSSRRFYTSSEGILRRSS